MSNTFDKWKNNPFKAFAPKASAPRIMLLDEESGQMRPVTVNELRGDKGNNGDSIKGDRGDDGRGIKSLYLKAKNLIVSYTDGDSENIGVIVGNDGRDGVSIIDAVQNSNGELVVYYSNGIEKNCGLIRGKNGEDGKPKDGKDGRGIKNCEINEDGEFCIYYTDDTEENHGKIRQDKQNNIVSGMSSFGVGVRNNGSLIGMGFTNINFTGSGVNAITKNGREVTIDVSGGGGGTPAGSTTQIQYNNAGAFGASDRFTFANFQSVRGLEGDVTVPPLTAVDGGASAGGEYPDGSTVSIRLYPYVADGLSYIFDPTVYWEITQTYTGDNFRIDIEDIVFTGADGWVAVNNINSAGWLGLRTADNSSTFPDTGEEYAYRLTGSNLDMFELTREIAGQFEGEVVLKGATQGDGGRLVFQSTATPGGRISFESSPAVNGGVNQRFLLPASPSTIANSVLGFASPYSGSGDYMGQLDWLTPSQIGSGAFFNLDSTNTATAFGSQTFVNTQTLSSSVADVAILRSTAGTINPPAAGHGAGLVFSSKAIDNNFYATARISSAWTNATAATRAVRVKLFPITSLDGNGINIANAFGVASSTIGINGLEEAGTSTLLHAGLAANKGLVIKGAAAQTANLLEVQNSAGVVLSNITAGQAFTLGDGVNASGTLTIKHSTKDLLIVDNTSDGRMRLGAVGIHSQTMTFLPRDPVRGGAGSIAANGSMALAFSSAAIVLSGATTEPILTSNAATSITITPFNASTVPFRVRGAASQTGNLQQWQTSAGVTQLAIAANGRDFILDTTTGTKIGTATTQKLSLWDATPIVQPTTSVASATFVVDSGGSIHPSSTFDGYTIAQVVKALRNIGVLA